MLRPYNLIPKYLTDKIKNAALLPKSEAKVAAATAANTIPNKSGRPPQVMREVCTSDRALSSLSFSTSGGSTYEDDDVTRGDNGDRGTFSSSSSSSGERYKLPTAGKPTSLKTSNSCQGRLVARTLPKKYAEYDSHKPATQIDPTASIASLVEWQKEHERSSGLEDTDGGAVCIRLEDESPIGEDGDEVVVLDLYLFRKSFLDDEQADEKQNITSAQREQRLKALIGSYDLSRNVSSHPRVSRGDSTFISTNISAAKDDDYFIDNIFHFHMNRSSNELMSRTLRRLELSATRKLQSLSPLPSGKKSNGNRGKEANLALINKVTSSKLVLLNDELKCEVVGEYSDGSKCCPTVDLAGLSSSDILRSISSGGNRLGVALTVPAVILPWVDRDQGVDEEEQSDETSSSSVNYNALETVVIEIKANPPTVVEVQTFEAFTAHNFVGVPIVMDTTIIHATRAIITWFVDGNVVAHDSTSYTPVEEDIGKSVSVLITPVRPDHNGEGCQEAYEFINVVEPLPLMPIMKLREGWSQVNVVKRDAGNNLRVLTVSSVDFSWESFTKHITLTFYLFVFSTIF